MTTVIAEWFAGLGWIDLLDISLVIVLLYQVYRLIKGTGAHKIFIGLLTVIVLWRLADYLNFSLTAGILGSILNVGAIAIFIIFQPEIRRFLQEFNTRSFIERGKKRFSFLRFLLKNTTKPKLNTSAIVEACSQMSQAYTGALIVISNDNQLEYPVSTGERIDATVSAQLLETIFFKNTPLHDGAVIISHNKIVAARCILPLSASPNIPANLGLRHRSAIGITEQSDAFAIVVSEQTGKISFIKAGGIQRNITPGRLRELLSEGFSNPGEKQDLSDVSKH
ncbi:MAG: diadenylate cyclase CdaA [Bacteroidales bacterium]|nr:diadenylate cyclase CdaA [Bacteroidales bacterium]